MQEHRTPPGSLPPARLVWDLPLRLFHWLLVLAIAGAWATHKLGVEYFEWHVWFGYATLVLVFFRVLWGFFGPRNARFGSFLRGPRDWWRHARSLAGRAPERYAGHSPLGALMIVFLLCVLLLLGVTGLFANDEIMNSGALYGYVSDATSDSISWLHRQSMDVLWIAAGLHVSAVLGYLLVKRQNLIWPMITGRKRESWLAPEDETGSSRLLLAVFFAVLGALLLYIAVATAPEPSRLLF